MSWCQLSDCYRIKGKNDQAIAAAFEAMQEIPEWNLNDGNDDDPWGEIDKDYD